MKEHSLDEQLAQAQANFRAANEDAIFAHTTNERERAFAEADTHANEMRQLREAMHSSHQDMSPGALQTIGKLVSRVFSRS